MRPVVTAALLLALSAAAALASQTKDESWRPPKPEKCGRNEVWKQCVSRGCGENTCPPKKFEGCLSTCDFGCYCADGFFRDPQGRCISECHNAPSSEPPSPHPPPGPAYPPPGPRPYPPSGPPSGPRPYLPSGPYQHSGPKPPGIRDFRPPDRSERDPFWPSRPRYDAHPPGVRDYRLPPRGVRDPIPPPGRRYDSHPPAIRDFLPAVPGEGYPRPASGPHFKPGHKRDSIQQQVPIAID
uniref:Putative tick til 1 n=1 Tax=Amblyomma parvum TaxID=251391 RepID=A0A023G0Q5_AMBPA